MPESTEESQPGIIDGVIGKFGDLTGRNLNFITRFHPNGPNGIPFRPITKPPVPVYDEKGKPQPLHSSTGIIVDIEA